MILLSSVILFISLIKLISLKDLSQDKVLEPIILTIKKKIKYLFAHPILKSRSSKNNILTRTNQYIGFIIFQGI
jgi:hypothetical protein